MRYYSSLGYMDEKGNTKGEDNKRYTGMLKLNLNYNRFGLNFQLNANLQKKEYTPEAVGVADYAYNTSRSIRAYNPDGSLYFYDKDATSTYLQDFNMINEMNNSSQNIDTDETRLTLSLNYRILENLKADVTFSYGISHTTDETWYGEDSYYILNLKKVFRDGIVDSEAGEVHAAQSLCPSGGELRKEYTTNENYNLRGTISWNKNTGEDSYLSANIIGELSSSKYTGYAVTKRGYMVNRGMIFDDWDEDKYPAYDEWMHTTEARGKSTHNLTNLVAAIASVSWSYKNTYILNANMRMDWSNKFGDRSNEKFLPIWSVSGRWNMHDDVLYGLSWVNQFALKASFGYQGNMSNAESPRLIITKGGTNVLYDEYESTIDNFPNPLLKWEKTSNFNISADFALFGEKFVGSVGYYYRHTKDAFMSKTISRINGRQNYTVNRGELTNQGFEFNFRFTPINNMINKATSAISSMTSGGVERKGFRWRFDPQFGTVINQLIDKIKPKDKVLQDEITIQDYLDGGVQVAGRPVNTFYSYRFKGLNHDTGAPEFYGTDQYQPKVDDDGNPVLDEYGQPVMQNMTDVYNNMEKEDVWMLLLEHSGCREPFLQGGLSNTFEYNNWILSFNLAYSIGSKVRLFRIYQNGASLPAPEQNLRRDLQNRWRVPGDEQYTNIPGIIGGKTYTEMNNPWWNKVTTATWRWASNLWDMYDYSNVRVASGNYLKLSSIQLRYVVPASFCQKLHLKDAYLSVSGTNIFTITSKAMKGQDPSQSGSTELINISTRPTYSLTLNVTF